MDHCYPGTAWLRLNRDVFDELYRYKRQRGFASWEDALQSWCPSARRRRGNEFRSGRSDCAGGAKFEEAANG